MFSKKKKTSEPDVILVDNMVGDMDPDGREQRDAFRYIFAPDKRLPMTFKEKNVEVFDISAGGLAFKNRGFKQYDADKVVLMFDMPNHNRGSVFSAKIRILHISSNHLCHCIFENCTVGEYEIIHKYVLEMQKQDLNARQ